MPNPKVVNGLKEAVLQEFPTGVRGQGLKLISDNAANLAPGLS